MKPGFVYLIRAENGLVKIGRSADPAKRLLQFSSLPVAVELVHQIATNDMAWLEAELHTEYADRRIRGEWFSLGTADVEALTGVAVHNRDALWKPNKQKRQHLKHALQVRAPVGLSQAINGLTKHTHRTRSAELVLALEQHLADYGLWPPPKQTQ